MNDAREAGASRAHLIRSCALQFRLSGWITYTDPRAMAVVSTALLAIQPGVVPIAIRPLSPHLSDGRPSSAAPTYLDDLSCIDDVPSNGLCHGAVIDEPNDAKPPIVFAIDDPNVAAIRDCEALPDNGPMRKLDEPPNVPASKALEVVPNVPNELSKPSPDVLPNPPPEIGAPITGILFEMEVSSNLQLNSVASFLGG